MVSARHRQFSFPLGAKWKLDHQIPEKPIHWAHQRCTLWRQLLPPFLLSCSSSDLHILPWRMIVHWENPAQAYHSIPALDTAKHSDPNTALDCCLTRQRAALKARTNIPEFMIWSLLCTDVGWLGFIRWHNLYHIGQGSECAVWEHRSEFAVYHCNHITAGYIES